MYGNMQRLEHTTFLLTCAAGWEQRARDEVRRVLPDAQVRPLFMRGNLLLTTDAEPSVALQLLADADTRTLGRVVPLQASCQVGKAREHLETLAAACHLLPGPSPEGTFKVACTRRGTHEWTSRDAEIAVAEAASALTGAEVDMRQPEQVISVEVFQDLAYLGVSWCDELLRKQITRMRKYAPGTRPISRAELKLREIIQRFDLHLPAHGRALDLGAAPGGWTRVLAEHMAQVVAVDPADLDPRVLALSNVTHLRVRSEALMAHPPADLFDVLTNDMNMDPSESARVLCDLALLLRPGGLAIMTVKFVTRRRRQHVQEALSVLATCYEDPRVGHVPHNAQETTVVVRRRPSAPGSAPS